MVVSSNIVIPENTSIPNLKDLLAKKWQKVYIIEFVSRSCPSCKEEFDSLSKLKKEYPQKIELFTAWIEEETNKRFLMDVLGSKTIPTMIIFKYGTFNATHVGLYDYNEIKEFILPNEKICINCYRNRDLCKN